MTTIPTLLLAALAAGFTPAQDTPPVAPAIERKALDVPFEFLNPGEFGGSASVRDLLARDDVRGVAVTFVASFMDGFAREGMAAQALHDAYRKRGVALIVSVEPSSGSKGVKDTIAEKKLTVPVSLTEKQWGAFQKVAGEKGMNVWPWTFYVDESLKIVEIARSTPSSSSLEAIAAAEGEVAVAEPAAGEGAPAAPPIPGVLPGSDPEAEKPSETVGEITVHRPPLPLWRFVSKEGGFGERILLAKSFPPGGASDASASVFEDTWGIEALSLLGRYEAAVLVTTLDRGSHTSIGSHMVDPGSKAQLVDAHVALIQKHVKKAGKPKKNSNASLGGVAAAQLRMSVTADDGRSFDVTGYFVPMKAFTYAVWFLLPADAPKPLEKELDDIRKAVKFSRGSGN